MRWCYISLLVVLFSFNSIAQTYKNLALKGGGIRGIAYVGCVKVLQEKHILDGIENVCGTSVGAVVATLIATGYTADEMYSILDELRLQSFNDGQWIFIGGQYRVRKQFGWYRGNSAQSWIAKRIEDKTGNGDLSFRQLHELALKDHKYKDLYITATNLSLQKTEVFCWKTYPDMLVKTATRASMSVPLYYRAVFLDSMGREVNPKKNAHYHVFVDGGVMANYPLNVFDSGGANMQTLGLKLERRAQLATYANGDSCIAPYNINNLSSYIGAAYNIIMESMNRNMSYADERARTIYISTSDIAPKVKRIKKKEKELLFHNGKEAAEKFFDKQGR